MKLKIMLLAVLFGLCACDDSSQRTQPLDLGVVTHSDRFEIKKVGKFYDDSAYQGSRCIYVLTDKQSGKEYVGISGIGISELGSHAVGNGKTVNTIPDER